MKSKSRSPNENDHFADELCLPRQKNKKKYSILENRLRRFRSSVGIGCSVGPDKSAIPVRSGCSVDGPKHGFKPNAGEPRQSAAIGELTAAPFLTEPSHYLVDISGAAIDRQAPERELRHKCLNDEHHPLGEPNAAAGLAPASRRPSQCEF